MPFLITYPSDKFSFHASVTSVVVSKDNDAAVNEALRLLIQVAQRQQPSPAVQRTE